MVCSRQRRYAGERERRENHGALVLADRWRTSVWPFWGLAGIAFLYLPSIPGIRGIFPACPFLSLTGCYCPGCGTLRALHTLLRGDVAGAIGYNVLTVLSLPFIAYSLWHGGDEGVRT